MRCSREGRRWFGRGRLSVRRRMSRHGVDLVGRPPLAQIANGCRLRNFPSARCTAFHALAPDKWLPARTPRASRQAARRVPAPIPATPGNKRQATGRNAGEIGITLTSLCRQIGGQTGVRPRFDPRSPDPGIKLQDNRCQTTRTHLHLLRLRRGRNNRGVRRRHHDVCARRDACFEVTGGIRAERRHCPSALPHGEAGAEWFVARRINPAHRRDRTTPNGSCETCITG